MRGIVLLALNRTQEAIQVFEEIYAKDKAYGGAMLGFSYGIANQPAQAQRLHRRWSSSERDFPR